MGYLLNEYKNKEIFLNIFLGFIPYSKVRKPLRAKFLHVATENKCDNIINSANQINNNKFIIVNEGVSVINGIKEGININFIGQNSTVIIHEPIYLQGCSIKIGNNSKIEIFSSKHEVVNLYISATNNSKVLINEYFSCRGCSVENHDESNLKVIIGKDCMFSYGIHIRVSDGHSIYQSNNSKIINKPQNGVTIGDHVWIGMNSTILKDVSIPSNSVVGACSLVNKSINKENVIIAGIPAKIIKEDINWSRNNTDDFESNKVFNL